VLVIGHFCKSKLLERQDFQYFELDRFSDPQKEILEYIAKKHHLLTAGQLWYPPLIDIYDEEGSYKRFWADRETVKLAESCRRQAVSTHYIWTDFLVSNRFDRFRRVLTNKRAN
jgi:hypothetical protein